MLKADSVFSQRFTINVTEIPSIYITTTPLYAQSSCKLLLGRSLLLGN